MSWRAIGFINPPIAVGAVAVTPFAARGSRDETVGRSVDFAGAGRPDAESGPTLCLLSHPHYNRREFVPRAIDCFLNQDYADRELIVIDDGTDPIEDVVLPDPRLRWVRLESRQTIGAKRNAGADAAAGQLSANSGDDDGMPRGV